MARYAATTEISSERTRGEIERLLVRYGAEGFLYGWETGMAVIGFRMNDRQLRFRIPLPDRSEFRYTPERRYTRSAAQQTEAYEQAVRQRWRALLLIIKAKLEAVESKVSVFEEEFLAHIVLPTGETYGDFAIPQIADVYESGHMPALVPGADQKALPAAAR